MIQFIAFLVCLLILGGIFLRRYLLTHGAEKFFSRLSKRRLIHKADAEVPIDSQEITVDEMLPSKDDVNPKNRAKADTLVHRAETFINKGNLKAAAQALIEAISLDPSSVPSHEKLAFIFLKEGFFGKAENIYRRLILTVMDDPAYLSNLALALFSQGKHSEAKKYYQRAIELDDTRAGRFFSLAQVNKELKEFEEAINNFRRALSMDPRNIDYILTLAQFYIEINQLTDAKQLLSELLLVDSENEIAKDLLNKIS